eukprot:TRINITY_DN10720_c0_g1_i1.p1 TRINITY_DN10720_c0_g1~~TRINITY_DN10720_c0_g1_i1.p1  ORF type:complete len:226 (-),score=38.94 TRINITY_DN10720_c0_g1_i1:175-804(-)
MGHGFGFRAPEPVEPVPRVSHEFKEMKKPWYVIPEKDIELTDYDMRNISNDREYTEALDLERRKLHARLFSDYQAHDNKYHQEDARNVFKIIDAYFGHRNSSSPHLYLPFSSISNSMVLPENDRDRVAVARHLRDRSLCARAEDLDLVGSLMRTDEGRWEVMKAMNCAVAYEPSQAQERIYKSSTDAPLVHTRDDINRKEKTYPGGWVP